MRPVSEEVRHPRHSHRLGRVAAVAHAGSGAAVDHLLGQVLERPLARGVQLEGDLHERGTLGVGDDVRYLMLTPADRLTDALRVRRCQHRRQTVKVDWSLGTPSVDAVTESWANRSIRHDPEYQRGLQWKRRQQQLLIESIFSGCPLPRFNFERKASKDPRAPLSLAST